MAKTTPASDCQGGTLVLYAIDGEQTVCLKAFRIGKEWVHHYLIPLDPLPGTIEEMRMVYVDPDEALLPCASSFALSTQDQTETEEAKGAAPATSGMAVGRVLRNSKGAFLKVYDADADLRHFAYVHLESGEIMRRQERGVTAQAHWTCNALGGDPRTSFFSRLKARLGA